MQLLALHQYLEVFVILSFHFSLDFCQKSSLLEILFLSTLHCLCLLQMWEAEVKPFPPPIPFFGLFSNNDAIIFQQQDWIALGISIHSVHQSSQAKNILDRITTLSVQYIIYQCSTRRAAQIDWIGFSYRAALCIVGNILYQTIYTNSSHGVTNLSNANTE